MADLCVHCSSPSLFFFFLLFHFIGGYCFWCSVSWSNFVWLPKSESRECVSCESHTCNYYYMYWYITQKFSALLSLCKNLAPSLKIFFFICLDKIASTFFVWRGKPLKWRNLRNRATAVSVCITEMPDRRGRDCVIDCLVPLVQNNQCIIQSWFNSSWVKGSGGGVGGGGGGIN